MADESALQYAKEVYDDAKKLNREINDEQKVLESAITWLDQAIHKTERVAKNIAQHAETLNHLRQEGHRNYQQALNIHQEIVGQYVDNQYQLDQVSMSPPTLSLFSLNNKKNSFDHSENFRKSVVNANPTIHLKPLQHHEKYWDEMAKDVQLLDDQLATMFSEAEENIQQIKEDGLLVAESSAKSKQPKREVE